MRYYPCANCGLPDLHNGDGDGIGSCECPRCGWCDSPPLMCDCETDDDGGFGWDDEEAD